MPVYKGLNGNEYVTKNEIGSGGEGIIYDLIGHPGFVAKILREKFLNSQRKRSEREEKLKFLLRNRPDLEDYFAWPRDILYKDREFAGFTMPVVSCTKELFDAINDKKNKWDFYVKIAINLAAATHKVHEINEICIGDFNPHNFFVDNDAMLKIIDVDSFHVKSDSKTYRCVAKFTEYLPPELQEIDINKASDTFTKESDRFALSVMIFRLLVEAVHPFNCTTIGSEKLTGQEMYKANILNGLSPYFGCSDPNCFSNFKKIPNLNYIFPKNVQIMFIQAFVDGHKDPSRRPIAADWYKVLNEINFVKCGNGHRYSSHSSKCPWCSLITPKPFVPITKPPPPPNSVTGVKIIDNISTSSASQIPITGVKIVS